MAKYNQLTHLPFKGLTDWTHSNSRQVRLLSTVSLTDANALRYVSSARTCIVWLEYRTGLKVELESLSRT